MRFCLFFFFKKLLTVGQTVGRQHLRSGGETSDWRVVLVVLGWGFFFLFVFVSHQFYLVEVAAAAAAEKTWMRERSVHCEVIHIPRSVCDRTANTCKLKKKKKKKKKKEKIEF